MLLSTLETVVGGGIRSGDKKIRASLCQLEARELGRRPIDNIEVHGCVSVVTLPSVGRCFDVRRIWFPAIQRECQAAFRHSECPLLSTRPSVDPVPETPETLMAQHRIRY